MVRHVLHADMDAFYASVEQRDNPALRGKPVVVGGSPEGRGVVAAASYEVRKFGVRSAMPMFTAMRLCPQAVRVPPRFDVYHEVSEQVMAVFHGYTPLVEPMSLDEAYLDVTALVTLENTPRMIAAEIKRRVKAETKLTISIGVATSKSVAKVASGLEKPDGLTVVPPGTEQAFLAPLPVDKLWGVGPKTAARLAEEGVRIIGDLAAKDAAWMRAHFGKVGPFMLDLALGEDDRPVVVEHETKSVSAETTLARYSGDAEELEELVTRLSQRVWRRLEGTGLQGHTVKMKLRLSDFTTFTRQETLPEPVESAESLAQAAKAILRTEMQPGRLFRLVGVGVSGFEGEAVQEYPLQPRLSGFE